MLDKTIEKFLLYGKYHLFLDENDLVFKRNILLHHFKLNEAYNFEIEINEEPIKSMETPTVLINELKKDLPDISAEEIEELMSIISLAPSELINRFKAIKEDSSEKACLFFYDQMIKNNYIKADDIKKNLFFQYETENNTLDITINLAKPEKDNKDIEKSVNQVSSSYPKCLLCYENLGFYGGGAKPARSNIRVIPLRLNDEDWFMQYSPYSYFNEHAIVIKKEHSPMRISRKTITRLLDFLNQFPNYFIGSNSDLPIVGGSMLYHEHFQAGNHLMPLMKSRVRYKLSRRDISDVDISYLDFFNSCFRLRSKNKERIIEVAEFLINAWKGYSDKDVDIVCEDEEGRHSTVTPIARKVDDTYYVYLILRNNRKTEEYPDGIFHAHSQYHNIKKEGIGLIEAMGLFILPGRLLNELSLIENILSNNETSIREIVAANDSLQKHLNFINYLFNKYQRNNKKERAEEIVKLEIGNICENILKNTGVFKDTIAGQSALFKLFRRLQFEVE